MIDKPAITQYEIERVYRVRNLILHRLVKPFMN